VGRVYQNFLGGTLSAELPATATVVTDGATTNTDTTVTSATAAFTSDDVGVGVSGSGIPAGTRIASVTSATEVELDQAATATATGVTLTFERHLMMRSGELAAMREVTSPDTMTVTLDPTGGDPELVLVTEHGVGETVAYVERAQESTAAATHVTTTTEWRHDWTAEAINESRVKVEDEAGTSYTVVEDDEGAIKRFTDASAVTVSLPPDLPPGFLVHLLFVGAAGGTVQADTGATVNGGGTVAQHGEASCLVETTDTWNVQGAN